MLRTTPDSLGVKLIVSSSRSPVFILCHPVYENHPDRSRSVVFRVAGTEGEVLRIFEFEIVAIDVLGNGLFAVDNRQKVYRYSDGTWTDFDNDPLVPYRINGLRVVEGELYGVADDGLVFLWSDGNWTAITSEVEDQYLFDLVFWPGKGLVVSGDEGTLATIEGGELSRFEMPTNVALTSLTVMPDNSLLVTGRRATAIFVRDDEVVQVDPGERTLSFLNSVVWKGHTLVAANSEIVEIAGVQATTYAEIRTGRLHVQGNVLWRQSDGAPFFTENGEDWTEIQLSVDM